MSASTSTSRRARHDDANTAQNETAHEETAATSVAPATVTIEIADQEVTLPVKFVSGHVLTETQARILDAAYQRQFTNNQNAQAKARKEKGKPALSATELAALYVDYEPSVGVHAGGTGLTKLRDEMAWRFWTSLVAEHNAAVAAGGAPVIVKAGAKQIALASRPRKTKDVEEATHAAALKAFDDNRAASIARLHAHSEYGPKIAAMVEAELAARKAESAATAPKEALAADLDLI